MSSIEDAPNKSTNNRSTVQNSAICGCYFCCTTFDSNQITDWMDEGATALCPRCGIDAVLPGVDDMEFLKKACAYWFTLLTPPG